MSWLSFSLNDSINKKSFLKKEINKKKKLMTEYLKINRN